MSDSREAMKQMDGRELAQAWNEWKESPEGQSCLTETASGQYLENRLWRAFMACAKAMEEANAKS